jgi:chromosome segregation ATPase
VADVDPAELRRVAEDLYGGLPGDFVATRAAAVKRLKAAGDKATAAAVADLRRPVQAAWAVNLLVREQGELVGQLLDLGASLREAQASLDADTLRELTRERRRVVAQVTRAAASAVADEGQALSEAARRQVEDTLLAAVVDAELADVVRSGLLVQPLSSTGMSSLADVQAIPGAARLELVRARPAQRAQKSDRTPADDADAGGATKKREKSERVAERRESERADEERRRTRERTRLQKVLETEQRAVRTSDSEVARLEQDVATARSRLARAEAELERASTKQESVRARLAATEEALDALS